MEQPRLLRAPRRFETIEAVLETARKLDLPNVLVLSELDDGRLVILESADMTCAAANWLLDRAKAVIVTPSSFERDDSR